MVFAAPGAGVLVFEDHDAGGEGAEAWDRHVIKGDDWRVAGPDDSKGERKRDVVIAVLDACGDQPIVSFELFGLGDGVTLFAKFGVGLDVARREVADKGRAGHCLCELLFQLGLRGERFCRWRFGFGSANERCADHGG